LLLLFPGAFQQAPKSVYLLRMKKAARGQLMNRAPGSYLAGLFFAISSTAAEFGIAEACHLEVIHTLKVEFFATSHAVQVCVIKMKKGSRGFL
jgi:hypothetical protein